MFHHFHPYPPFIPEGIQKLIIGTLPPPRFCTGVLKPNDVDFCYGSEDGLLWKALDIIFALDLDYEPSDKAIQQRHDFLQREKIGICDIVECCYRKKIDASDLGMQDIVLRDIMKIVQEHPSLHTLIFTGGNSKNGPEYLFRKHLKEHDLSLTCKDDAIPRTHVFTCKERNITTVSLTSPSNAANRSIGAHPYYKAQKAKDPAYSTFDFRVEQYSKVFKEARTIIKT